jgi:hypothetical protein
VSHLTLMTFTAPGRSNAHTECRNGVDDLERSGELCGRAIAGNVNEKGNDFLGDQRLTA